MAAVWLLLLFEAPAEADCSGTEGGELEEEEETGRRFAEETGLRLAPLVEDEEALLGGGGCEDPLAALIPPLVTRCLAEEEDEEEGGRFVEEAELELAAPALA